MWWPKVRAVGVPPGTPPAPFFLDRLRGPLEALAWTTEPRYEGSMPLLRVQAADTPCVGESIKVSNGWYISSCGVRLARCGDPNQAARRVDAFLAPWLKQPAPRRTERLMTGRLRSPLPLGLLPGCGWVLVEGRKAQRGQGRGGAWLVARVRVCAGLGFKL